MVQKRRYSVVRYDSESDAWQDLSFMLYPLCWRSLIECGVYLHATGGQDNSADKKYNQLSERHNPMRKTWEVTPRMNTPRHAARSALCR